MALSMTLFRKRCAHSAMIAVLFTATSVFAGDTPNTLLPTINITQGDKCVEPTDVIRREHSYFLLHQRDSTLREGVRSKKHSLKNCVNCHADPKTDSVLGKEGFCSSCHSYAAVNIDCFSCHTDKRESNAASLK